MNFTELNNSIKALSSLENVDFFVIGQSLLGQDIYGVHLGSYEGNQLLSEGAIHAREYITASLLVQLVREYSTRQFEGGMFFIPMVNPDGVRIVLDGLDWVKCSKTQNFLLDVNEYSEDFSSWKADANAVDLNVNFDALWGGGSQNVFCPAPGNFVGFYPNSEREVREMIEFTLKNNPAVTLSFHTKGEVIYYGFETLTPDQIERDKLLAEQVALSNGYNIVKTQYSTGGYSDWVSEYLKVPALTIEVGSATIPHPISEEYLPAIFEQNKEVPQVALSFVNNDYSVSASASVQNENTETQENESELTENSANENDASEVSKILEKLDSPKLETNLSMFFTDKVNKINKYQQRRNRYKK